MGGRLEIPQEEQRAQRDVLEVTANRAVLPWWEGGMLALQKPERACCKVEAQPEN